MQSCNDWPQRQPAPGPQGRRQRGPRWPVDRNFDQTTTAVISQRGAWGRDGVSPHQHHAVVLAAAAAGGGGPAAVSSRRRSATMAARENSACALRAVAVVAAGGCGGCVGGWAARERPQGGVAAPAQDGSPCDGGGTPRTRTAAASRTEEGRRGGTGGASR